ncbi:nuclear transport factor 2 family protein [Massilia horti]|uniref:Nuclear transport factor 2 family protein n=1 Tax=Massilia horti TaxID=2562153 RepID=A0A4Y9T3Q2_9BURK|nr:nuclear transport factor 2 family protein [Massilia horti]TFW32789.1 nuclear transport factor 2 family protein [Massilia horti]
MRAYDPEDLINQYIAAYNAFDLERMFELIAEDIRFENYSSGELTARADGLEEFRRLAEGSKGLFVEREQRVTGLELTENEAIAEIAYRGRLAIDIPGGPQAGTVLNLNGTSEFSFANGKINRIIDRS